MYIRYCCNQKSTDPADKTDYRLSVAGGDYRHTWLVRVSDWQKLPGKEAVDGYHTLSYCWEQSGEVVPKNDGSGEYDYIGNGQHCVVDYVNEDDEDSQKIIEKYVKYDEPVQQVCHDFQVDYLWYDKMCINQSDKNIKLREIKRMHQIYRNARFTIAMVPEVGAHNPMYFEQIMPQYGTYARYFSVDQLDSSDWMKRSWTLEEVMMTKGILMVGSDTNMFQHSLHTTDIPSIVDKFSSQLLHFGGDGGKKGSVSTKRLVKLIFEPVQSRTI